MVAVSHIVPEFDVEAVRRLLAEECDPEGMGVSVGDHPAGGTVLTVRRDGEPTGVELVVGDLGCWARIDGKDMAARPVESFRDSVADVMEEAMSRSTPRPG